MVLILQLCSWLNTFAAHTKFRQYVVSDIFEDTIIAPLLATMICLLHLIKDEHTNVWVIDLSAFEIFHRKDYNIIMTGFIV